METAANFINSIIWSDALVFLCVATGVYFSFATRFLQVRYIREMVRLLFDGKASKEGVSSFQAFSIAISGRVGTGNIVGVATAIAWVAPERYSGCGQSPFWEQAQHSLKQHSVKYTRW